MQAKTDIRERLKDEEAELAFGIDEKIIWFHKGQIKALEWVLGE